MQSFIVDFSLEGLLSQSKRSNLGKEDDGVEELLEGDPSVAVPVDDVEHLEHEDVFLAHAQRRRKLLLGQRRPHHHDDVTRHVLQLKVFIQHD